MHKSNVTIDPTSGYEKRDVSLSTILRWVIFLFAFVGVCAFLAWVSYVIFLPKGKDRLAIEPVSPTDQRPPSPVLQAYPKTEMHQFRAQENAAVTSYGWANKEKTEVRIPINHAVELLAERGLPVGQQPVSKNDADLRPGNKNAGASAQEVPGNGTVTPPASGMGAPSSTESAPAEHNAASH